MDETPSEDDGIGGGPAPLLQERVRNIPPGKSAANSAEDRQMRENEIERRRAVENMTYNDIMEVNTLEGALNVIFSKRPLESVELAIHLIKVLDQDAEVFPNEQTIRSIANKLPEELRAEFLKQYDLA